MGPKKTPTRVVRIFIAEGSLVKEVKATVVKRGIRGPGGLDYWLVETKPARFVQDRPPARYLLLGPGGRAERLDWMDDNPSVPVGCHVMLDDSGLAPELEPFDFSTAYDFGRGHIQRLE